MSEDSWQDLVDLGKLGAWMDDRGLGRGPIENPAALAGGTQNILLRFERCGRSYVLRRRPRSPRRGGYFTPHPWARGPRAPRGAARAPPRHNRGCPSTRVDAIGS